LVPIDAGARALCYCGACESLFTVIASVLTSTVRETCGCARKGKQVSLDGELLTYKELSVRYGVAPTKIRLRVERYGYTVRQAVGLDRKPKGTVLYEGKLTSLIKLAKEHGLSDGTVRNRMKYGASLEEALTKDTQVKKRRNYTYEGREWTIPELSRKYGLSDATLRQRLITYGWSVHKAVTTHIVQALPNVPSAAECKKHGLKKATVYRRIQKGWTTMDALRTPVGRKPFK
jgi:uncharacterized protein YjcR